MNVQGDERDRGKQRWSLDFFSFLLFGRLLNAQTRKVNSREELGWVGAGLYRVVVLNYE